ncbi:MAG: signal recognition particle receptor subunit alpha, partial [Clostridia bacterium]|nr:signal recognition particle receptor subunit alpha [Clostridia bacterium]
MGFFDKLKSGLAKTKKAVFAQVDNILKSFVKVDEDLLEELEEVLICSDMGMETVEEIIDELRDQIKSDRLKAPEDVKTALKELLRERIGEGEELKLCTTPSVILVIGVNGVGKTTSIGKIAANLKSQGKKVVVAAADTFRAA